MMYLFRIITTRWTGDTGQKIDEFVVADNIQQVIKYSEIDLQDKGMEVEAMVREVPVTRILVDLPQAHDN